ncbi:ABC transporter ATP-binding protein [Actinokineospora sp. UTMC 2448]|uniref:ABC transporter ATP-binding protein n=1 Tax=Actinokineospora sp. UTMC 2448 TaxID=2268449 RepID=UPI002164321B|nr:ATP-binding cassette domain-containing protein [Actinokineospora sp. UTMC 2448]UVS79338.1 Macrolide export ATP-binding/permease protein MacB [Actinokineospora sp. UTMC 2448]
MAELLTDDPLFAEGPAPLFEVDRVRVEYPTPAGPVPALEEVTVTVPADGLTVLAGPSGSGKSTLLRVLGLIDRPTAGSVRVSGRDVGGLGHRQRRLLRRDRIALVVQYPPENLIGHLTVGQNLRAAAESARVPADPDAVLGWLGIPDTADWRVEALSGGQQQRLAFGCALARRPAVVLADEPTSQLDAASAALVLDVVDRLVADGVPVVVASHDDEVIARAHRVVRLREGRIEEAA